MLIQEIDKSLSTYTWSTERNMCLIWLKDLVLKDLILAKLIAICYAHSPLIPGYKIFLLIKSLLKRG